MDDIDYLQIWFGFVFALIQRRLRLPESDFDGIKSQRTTFTFEYLCHSKANFKIIYLVNIGSADEKKRGRKSRTTFPLTLLIPFTQRTYNNEIFKLAKARFYINIKRQQSKQTFKSPAER
jgi:hypothetical protein